MQKKNIMNGLGLAQRAGKIATGSLTIEKNARNNKIKILLIAEDISAGSEKEYVNLANQYHFPFVKILTKEELGKCIGKEYRAAAAILDGGFAELISKTIDKI